VAFVEDDRPLEQVRAAPPIPDEPDRSAPLFFVSHANAHNQFGPVGPVDSNKPFMEFFKDLSLNVGQLEYRRSGADPGFIDRGSLRAGKHWEQEILKAVGTCQVFIGLVSSPYTGSPWCGREWDAFSRRTTWRREDGARSDGDDCIIPVLWAPIRQSAIPPVILGYEMFSPQGLPDSDIAARYEHEGVFGLLNTNRDAYTATVWRLAQEINDRLQDYWVEPNVATKVTELKNLFGLGSREGD
jgi:TIR domain